MERCQGAGPWRLREGGTCAGSLWMLVKIHYNQPHPTTGEKKRLSLRAAAATNNNEDDNTRI